MTQDLDKLKEHLHRLASKAIQVAKKALEERRIQPHEEPYFKWKIRRFKYTEEGISYSQAEGQYVTSKSWDPAVFILSAEIANTEEYRAVLESLPKPPEGRYPTEHIDSFLTNLLKKFLEAEDFKQEVIDNLIETFVKDIEGKSTSFTAEVELCGITLGPQRIDIAEGICLKKPTCEDLEIKIPVYELSVRPTIGPPSPSAIMIIDMTAQKPQEVQKAVKKAVTILRLFRVGGVDFNYCRIVCDTVIRFGSLGQSPGTPWHPMQHYMLRERDIRRLRRFWKDMDKVLPEYLYWGSNSGNSIKIAYERYSEALLNQGPIEQRIANLMMGFEAVLLRPEEQQELSYRLSYRAAKLLSLLGFDAIDVARKIKEAYDVRSRYAHGGQLTQKKLAEINKRVGSISALFRDTCDYLRITLLIAIFANKSKEEFVSDIDRALLDRKAEKDLRQFILRIKHLLR